MRKMTAVLAVVLFSALSSQAADLNRCFTHSDGEKGHITLSETSIVVDWNVEFNSKREVEANSSSYMVKAEVDKGATNTGSTKSVIGDALLLGITGVRDQLDNKPKVRVAIDKGFVSFQVLPFENEPLGRLHKYPITACH